MEFIVLMANFYVPIVSIPFLMTFSGFRTPYKNAVLYGMCAALLTVILWMIFDIQFINVLIPASFINLFVIFTVHHYYANEENVRIARNNIDSKN